MVAYPRIVVRGERCRTAAQKLSGLLWERRPHDGIAIMGPAEAPLTRAMNRYRWQILLKGESKQISGHLEHPPEDLSQFEIGLEFLLIQGESFQFQLL